MYIFLYDEHVHNNFYVVAIPHEYSLPQKTMDIQYIVKGVMSKKCILFLHWLNSF